MKKLADLNDLLTLELKDLRSAEAQIIKALPKLAKAAGSEELRSALNAHLEQTKEHLARLEQVGEVLGVKLTGHKCDGMEGLLKEGAELLEMEMPTAVMDAAIIAACQRVEHYEIAGYGCARAFAEELGHSEVARTLQITLDEEGAADHKLQAIAEGGINSGAAAQASAEEG
jgi:ferritin-like metal-binding protein YciE